jgi:DNA-binding NtrC family response regulator
MDLEKAVKEEASVFQIEIPPLRERPDDIMPPPEGLLVFHGRNDRAPCRTQRHFPGRLA